MTLSGYGIYSDTEFLHAGYQYWMKSGYTVLDSSFRWNDRTIRNDRIKE